MDPLESRVAVGTGGASGIGAALARAFAARGARLADVNGDTHLDVVCVARNGINGQVTTLLGDGSGGFTSIAGEGSQR